MKTEYDISEGCYCYCHREHKALICERCAVNHTERRELIPRFKPIETERNISKGVTV